MKTILVMMFVFLASPVFAANWCRWDVATGKGYGCVNDNRGYIKIHTGLRVGGGPDNYNSHGYYNLIITEPTIADNYKKDAKVWSFADNKINLTWTTIELTQTEKNLVDARTLSEELYYVLKWMVNTPGAVNTTTGQLDPSTAPAALKKAYLARQALEQ